MAAVGTTIRRADLLHRATAEVTVVDPPLDNLCWRLGWVLMRMAFRLMGFSGTRLHAEEGN